MDAGSAYDATASAAIHALSDDPAAAKRVYDRIGNAEIKSALANTVVE
jgi:hypothetical protein